MKKGIKRMKVKRISHVHFGILFVGAMIFSVCRESENMDTLFAGIDANLEKLVQFQKDIRDIHPFLKVFHPIAIVKDNYFYIFDFDSSSRTYGYIKKEAASFPMPKDIRASFPLSGYHSKPACFVTQDVFDSRNGFVTIFHEFIHCNQFVTCERGLKRQLNIARAADERNDYSWEINHPFPYRDSLFAGYYSQFIKALDDHDDQAILNCRTKLRRHLNQFDFEYMVWTEWKEGFARLIENRIQSHLGMEENQDGSHEPYSRVSFYHGGSKWIDCLVRKDPELFIHIEPLFDRMRSG
jgi:hypothetical protein